VVILIEKGVSDYLLNGHIVTASEPLQTLLNSFGRFQKPLAIRILAKLAELLAHQVFETRSIFDQNVRPFS
jgi:hypothetical protein